MCMDSSIGLRGIASLLEIKNCRSYIAYIRTTTFLTTLCIAYIHAAGHSCELSLVSLLLADVMIFDFHYEPQYHIYFLPLILFWIWLILIIHGHTLTFTNILMLYFSSEEAANAVCSVLEAIFLHGLKASFSKKVS